MAGIEDVTTKDLIRVLDRRTLPYFTGPELRSRLSPRDDPRQGIFVRLGRVIILGSTIDHGPKIAGRSLSLSHIYLVARGLAEFGEDVTETIFESAPEDAANYLRGRRPIVDAGNSRIDTYGDKPVGLVFLGESVAFGKVDPNERQITGEIARNILGPSITVDAF